MYIKDSYKHFDFISHVTRSLNSILVFIFMRLFIIVIFKKDRHNVNNKLSVIHIKIGIFQNINLSN